MAYLGKELNDTIWAAGGALMQIEYTFEALITLIKTLAGHRYDLKYVRNELRC
jgi:hypothetical protein